jgi:glycosyltransferase involved in cell wall biosynthesis
LSTGTLVSIGLPVRNAASRVEHVVHSVLAQDHGDIELVISDNASTDETQEVCRDLAASDSRIAYHRQPQNIGLLNNFIFVSEQARGTYFRWIGDDDRLEPAYVRRCLPLFSEDSALILVTTQVSYTGDDGSQRTGAYEGGGMASDDPVARFTEMLRLLNESHLQIDPLYGLFRRSAVVALPRRNVVREDEAFATRLALAGPWGHVPEVLAHRHWKSERIGVVAGRLGVPAWHSRFSNTLLLREILHWLGEADLTPQQQRRARQAAYQMYARREWRQAQHRGRKLMRIVTGR